MSLLDILIVHSPDFLLCGVGYYMSVHARLSGIGRGIGFAGLTFYVLLSLFGGRFEPTGLVMAGFGLITAEFLAQWNGRPQE